MIRKRLERSPADVKVCDLELARLLFVMMDDDEIEAEGLVDLLHSQKDPTEKKHRLIDNEMVGDNDKLVPSQSWIHPKRHPRQEKGKR